MPPVASVVRFHAQRTYFVSFSGEANVQLMRIFLLPVVICITEIPLCLATRGAREWPANLAGRLEAMLGPQEVGPCQAHGVRNKTGG